MTTTTDFAPITFNGEPVVTWRDALNIEIDGLLYVQQWAASEECMCRRCLLHEDFGGCIVAEAMWGLVLWMSDPIGTIDLYRLAP